MSTPSETPETVTADEAFSILQRFNNSHFRDCNQGECARYSIPARPDRDDDLRLAKFIEQYRQIERGRNEARAALYLLQNHPVTFSEMLASKTQALNERDQLRARVAELEKDKEKLVEALKTIRKINDPSEVLNVSLTMTATDYLAAKAIDAAKGEGK